MTRARLIVAIITTLLDDILILLLLFVGLPYFGVHLPLSLIIGIALLWVGFAVFLYLVGGKVLKKKPIPGFTDMVNTRGTVAHMLAPNGMVKIDGELWIAKSNGETIKKGERIIVIKQNNMELIVRRENEENG